MKEGETGYVHVNDLFMKIHEKAYKPAIDKNIKQNNDNILL